MFSVFFDSGNHTVRYCEDKSACRVVQKYINCYGDRLDIAPLLKNNYHIDLAQREYGNHVVQCIIKPDAWYVLCVF